MKENEAVQTSNFWNGSLSRRAFLSRIALVAGESVVALACGAEATAIPPTQAPPQLVPTEPAAAAPQGQMSIEDGPVEFEANGSKLLGYLSRPTSPGPHPAVLVVHENRGLLPHFPDVTRRLAREGYVALAVDMLSTKGGTGSFADTDAMRTALREISTEQVVEHGNAGVAYLQSQPYVIGDRIGAMGFCFGGGIVWRMAVGNPELRAAVPFYGSAPPLEDVPNLQVPVLGIYAGEDARIGAGVPDLEAALKANGKNYKFVTYPGAGHAFFNDTGRRYHEQAAGQAWSETLGWFEDFLMDS